MGTNPSKAELQRRIAQHLAEVDRLRAQAAADGAFGASVAALKRHQAARLAATYADLRAQDRYRAAVDFFVTDLYADRDFSRRDADLQRIVPTLGKLFPAEALATVEAATHLHALSEALDAQMAQAAAPACDWNDARYQQAWRAVGQPAQRALQLQLVLQTGHALDRLVHIPMIGTLLKAMAGPASMAGLAELHAFLVQGHGAFKALRGADEFLRIIEQREAALMARLFGTPTVAAV